MFLASMSGLATTYICICPMPITGVKSFEGFTVDLNRYGLAVSIEVGPTSSV